MAEWWAHNPHVVGSKLTSAFLFSPTETTKADLLISRCATEIRTSKNMSQIFGTFINEFSKPRSRREKHSTKSAAAATQSDGGVPPTTSSSTIDAGGEREIKPLTERSLFDQLTDDQKFEALRAVRDSVTHASETKSVSTVRESDSASVISGVSKSTEASIRLEAELQSLRAGYAKQIQQAHEETMKYYNLAVEKKDMADKLAVDLATIKSKYEDNVKQALAEHDRKTQAELERKIEETKKRLSQSKPRTSDTHGQPLQPQRSRVVRGLPSSDGHRNSGVSGRHPRQDLMDDNNNLSSQKRKQSHQHHPYGGDESGGSYRQPPPVKLQRRSNGGGDDGNMPRVSSSQQLHQSSRRMHSTDVDTYQHSRHRPMSSSSGLMNAGRSNRGRPVPASTPQQSLPPMNDDMQDPIDDDVDDNGYDNEEIIEDYDDFDGNDDDDTRSII